ncbi:MAG: FAD-dependent oxidoreductase [Usitatibacter sp.]
MKRLVLAGGGHAHIEVLRDLALNPHPGIQVEVVTPRPILLYTGMVPGHIAGHYALPECSIDVAELARRAKATLRLTTASLVSGDANELVCSDGTVLPYDFLSLDVGSQSLVGSAKGVEKYAISVRPLDRLVEGWNSVYKRAALGKLDSITIVGGGAGGIELALAMDHRLRATLEAPHPKVRVLAGEQGLGVKGGAARKLLRRMKRAGVDCHAGSTVTEVGAGFVRLASRLEFVTDAVFWATGAAAHGWIADSGLAVDERGFLLTNNYLQSISHHNVFGAGDCASIENQRRPKAGVFAVRAAPALAANLRAAIDGAPLRSFTAQRGFLALISTGDRNAVGTWNGITWEGSWAWNWKDRIDRRFIDRYRVPATA